MGNVACLERARTPRKQVTTSFEIRKAFWQSKGVKRRANKTMAASWKTFLIQSVALRKLQAQDCRSDLQDEKKESMKK